jgi:hypothetical protein
MAGLIDTTADGNLIQKDQLAPDKMAQAGTVGYDPATRTVGTDETVSGQLNKVLSDGSPVLDRARTRAAEVANSRGLLNSSMGVQAGEAAVIDAATPIAAADANVYGTAARENQAAKNTSLQVGTDATNRANLANAGDANAFAKMQEQGKIETGLQTLRGTQSKELANIEANYKNLIQASASAGRNFETSQSAITNIMADPNTSAEFKQNAVAKVSGMLQSSLTILGAIANLDLSGLLDFSAAG